MHRGSLRPVIVSRSDVEGGAAIAARRLHLGLRAAEVDSRMVVSFEDGEFEATTRAPDRLGRGGPSLRGAVDSAPLRLYRDRTSAPFTASWLPSQVLPHARELGPSVVNLHGIGPGMFRIEQLADLGVPLVWTAHDHYPGTGGCHLPGACNRYEASCGRCPQLRSNSFGDLSHRIWQRKARAYQATTPVVVSPSRWLAERLAKASLLEGSRIEIIPNGIDTSVFKPIHTTLARDILGLPKDVPVLLTAAPGITRDTNKGLGLAVAATERVRASGTDLHLAIVGGSKKAAQGHLHHLGRFDDEVTMALAYSAADGFLLCSAEENLPNTVAEALACSTPVIATAVGGVPEMLTDGEEGWLVQPGSVEEMAQAIERLLQSTGDELSRAAGKRGQSFAVENQVASYMTLFAELTV